MSMLTVDAVMAAKMLGISPAHFYNLRKTGRLGPVALRLGRAVRYRVAELEAWVAAGTPPQDRWNVIREKSLNR